MNREVTAILAERRRLDAEYERRQTEIDADLYSPWQPAELFARNERKRVAAKMLHAVGRFPLAGNKCLEVGCGSGGWLPDLLTWGIREPDLHGIDINQGRIEVAREILPAAELRTVDASDIPWEDDAFDLVIASTVFTSILDDGVRQGLASEIQRVLSPRGAFVWYDFAYNNPRNSNVRGIRRAEIGTLFPGLRGQVRRVTLAPPLARLIAPRVWVLAQVLEAVPLLRTHLLGVFTKDKSL